MKPDRITFVMCWVFIRTDSAKEKYLYNDKPNTACTHSHTCTRFEKKKLNTIQPATKQREKTGRVKRELLQGVQMKNREQN